MSIYVNHKVLLAIDNYYKWWCDIHNKWEEKKILPKFCINIMQLEQSLKKMSYIKELSEPTCISVGKVALKSMVCLGPGRGIPICSTILRIWGSNPISNILSASSKAKYLIIRRETLSLSIISTKRPGVATNMSTPFSRLRSWRRQKAQEK